MLSKASEVHTLWCNDGAEWQSGNTLVTLSRVLEVQHTSCNGGTACLSGIRTLVLSRLLVRHTPCNVWAACQ